MKIHMKSFILGFIISVFAVGAYAADGIRYAVFNGAKVIYNGRHLNLNGKRLISLAKEDERYASNYMPIRPVFEAMGFNVDWDANTKSVIVNSQEVKTDYSDLYWIPEDIPAIVETAPSVGSLTTTNFDKLSNKKISVPQGLVKMEVKDYKLIADMMSSDMNVDTGIASIIAVVKQIPVKDINEEKELCNALYNALSANALVDSKKAFESLQAPISSNSTLYKNAYSAYEKYVTSLGEMMKSLRNGNLQSALLEFDKAAGLYLDLLK